MVTMTLRLEENSWWSEVPLVVEKLPCLTSLAPSTLPLLVSSSSWAKKLTRILQTPSSPNWGWSTSASYSRPSTCLLLCLLSRMLSFLWFFWDVTTIRKEEREPSPFSSVSVSVIDLIIYHLSSLVVSNRESPSHVPLPTNPISFFSTSLPVTWIPDQQVSGQSSPRCSSNLIYFFK